MEEGGRWQLKCPDTEVGSVERVFFPGLDGLGLGERLGNRRRGCYGDMDIWILLIQRGEWSLNVELRLHAKPVHVI